MVVVILASILISGLAYGMVTHNDVMLIISAAFILAGIIYFFFLEPNHIPKRLKPSKLPVIDLSGVRGMVAVRRWDYCGGILTPANVGYHPTTWKTEIALADVRPEVDNSNGLYALLEPIAGGIMGIVELRGRVILHEDNVVRGEWAKILCLIVEDAKMKRKLSGRYHVPIYIVENPDDRLTITRRVLDDAGTKTSTVRN